MDPVSGIQNRNRKHIYLRNIQDTNETLFYRLETIILMR